MSLGLEGAIASRETAERCADVYRECLAANYAVDEKSMEGYRSRVGILEIPAPDARLAHDPPRDDVEEIVKTIRLRFARKRSA